MIGRQVEVVPGTHLVASSGGVLVVVAHRDDVAVNADSPSWSVLAALLELVRDASGKEKRRTGRVFARLATSWLMSLDDAEEGIEFGVVTPADSGLAVFLHGGITAVLSGPDHTDVLRGRDAGFTVDRVVIPAPGIGVGLFVDEDDSSVTALPERGVFALDAGTAAGSGAVLWFGVGAADSSQPIGREQDSAYPRPEQAEPVATERSWRQPPDAADAVPAMRKGSPSERAAVPSEPAAGEQRASGAAAYSESAAEGQRASAAAHSEPAAGEPRAGYAAGRPEPAATERGSSPASAHSEPAGLERGASRGAVRPEPAATERAASPAGTRPESAGAERGASRGAAAPEPVAAEQRASRAGGHPEPGAAGQRASRSGARPEPGPVEQRASAAAGQRPSAAAEPGAGVAGPRGSRAGGYPEPEASEQRARRAAARPESEAAEQWASAAAEPHGAAEHRAGAAGERRAGGAAPHSVPTPARQPLVLQKNPSAPPRAPATPVTPSPIVSADVAFAETAVAPSAAARAAAAIPPSNDDTGVMVKGFRCSRHHLNDPRVSFCAVCGIRMDQLTCVLTDGVRPPLGLLLLDDGTSIVLDSNCVLGREPEHAPEVERGAKPIRVEDLSGGMSRAHAEIRLIDWDVTVIDRGSANGTYLKAPGSVEWTRTQPGHPAILVPGAQILLGSRTLTFDSPHGQV